MPKNIKIIVGAGLVVIVAMIVGRLIFRSDFSATSQKLASNLGQIKDPENKTILSRLKIPTAKDKKPLSSIDKLDLAWQEGKIKLEDYIVLQLRALYGGNKLPSEYQGGPDREKDQAYIFALISENWSSLSKETQDAILPYLLPATNPKSYFHPAISAFDLLSCVNFLV